MSLAGRTFLFVSLLLGFSTSITNAVVSVDPNQFDLQTNQGCFTVRTLTIGNEGSGVLNFTLRSRETSREISGGLSGGGAGASMVKASEGNIILEYEFGKPVVSSGAEYDTVQIRGLGAYQQTGAPIVPVRPTTILVPFGKKVVNTRVIPLSTEELPGTYRLSPAQRPYPLNHDGLKKRTAPDTAIYGRKSPWPGVDHKAVATYSKRGYQLFVLNLFPVQYLPATGKLSYTTKMRVEVKLADSFEANVLRPSETTTSVLKRRVDNPSVLDSYNAEAGSVKKLGGFSALPGGGPYQYVIITNQTLANASGPWNFQALRDAKIAQGVTATIVTTEWIYANYDGTKPSGGSDNQTQIRNFLIDAYQTWGTQYVLLGGTNAIVPSRLFWVTAYPGGDTDYMPVDMYYGCVEPASCTFDYDADNKYGEPTDGVGGGDVDLYAEIYVGRAAVENATEVTNFVRKTLTYDTTAADYLSRIVMVGEYLGFGGVVEYATESMEQIRLGGTYDGYFTYGFENHTQTDFYDFDTSTNLYDAPGYDWPKSALTGLMNEGVHCFNHLGHANYTYDMKLYTSDLSSLTNNDYFFAYSQGCMPGGFDTTNCFAEVLTTIEHGAFATVMNARYGWGMYNSTDGPSQRFARQFWDAALDEDKLELGRANQDSKEDNLWDINGECIRWCYYELNLFGDPQQKLRFEDVCKWITLDPNEGTIGPWQSSPINVTFDAMELAAGVYGAQIIINSNDPCGSVIVPVTMTVSDDDLAVTPATGFEPNGVEGGPFVPACTSYMFTNNGTNDVHWTATETESWLNVDPNNGTLAAGAAINVNVCLLPEAALLDPNTYTATLTFENTDSGSVKTRPITLTVKPADRFTELFATGSNDVNGLTLTFSTNGTKSYYEACRGEETNAFPTDPDGGTYVSLWDDDFAQVTLNDANVLFYGTRYDSFYIGSNGYITFGQGDTEPEGTLENHFYFPRISGLFTDLNPPSGQCISYKQLDDRVAVTFKDVPLYGDKTTKHSFQIEMFFADGTIRITWLNFSNSGGVAGLSKGTGIPELFVQSNLSDYAWCCPEGDFDKNYSVNFLDFAVLANHWLDESCELPCWCEKTDLDFTGTVETEDLSIFADNWLVKYDWWLRPVAHWKLDETSGTIAHDSAGNNTGTLYGNPVWTSGAIGGALSFDGAGDYISCGQDPSLNITKKITLSAWVYTKSDNNAQIINRHGIGTGNYGWMLARAASSDSFEWRISITGSDWNGGTTSANSFGLDQWIHVAATYDGSVMRVYLNGVENTTGSFPVSLSGDIKIIPVPPLIGSDTAQTKYFNGTIDDVRIYDRSLSAKEILQLYHDGLSQKATKPNPSDGAISIDPNTILSWSPGKNAVSHDVYLGISFNDVNDSTEPIATTDVNNYDPGGLELETTYYWRIDEYDGTQVHKGDVWSFTTWAQFDPNLNLVSWWKFDEGTGTIAYDSTGNNHGTLNGPPTWTPGQIGGALQFDGIDDYVNVPDNPSLRFSQYSSFTISFWAKPLSATGGYTVCKMRSTGQKGIFGYELTWSPSLFGFIVESSGYGSTKIYTFDNSAPANNWYFATMVYDNKNMKIYFNGQLHNTGTFSYNTGSTTPDKALAIGARSYDTSVVSYFTGIIDDVRIYNKALSATEIQQLYQGGLH